MWLRVLMVGLAKLSLYGSTLPIVYCDTSAEGSVYAQVECAKGHANEAGRAYCKVCGSRIRKAIGARFVKVAICRVSLTMDTPALKGTHCAGIEVYAARGEFVRRCTGAHMIAVKLCSEVLASTPSRAVKANRFCPARTSRTVRFGSLNAGCELHGPLVISVCPSTGGTASSFCPSPTERSLAVRPDPCEDHRAIARKICSATGGLAGELCPSTLAAQFQPTDMPPTCSVHVPREPERQWFSLSGIELVRIPAGDFFMGSSKRKDETPTRTVVEDEFWIGKTEVTVSQFRDFCQASGYRFDWNGRKPKWDWNDAHPMVMVDWKEAAAYCTWSGGRLPTEAEWEKAARGREGKDFPWGNEWQPDRLHASKIDEADAGGTAPAHTLIAGASPYGCLGMAGNAWEWCSDWYGDRYDARATTNPTGPKSGRRKVFRGGGWRYKDSSAFRVTDRNSLDPLQFDEAGGFRLVLERDKVRSRQ